MNTKLIKTAAEYKEALNEIESLLDSDPAPNTKVGERLELLTLLVKEYESKRFPIDPPDPIEAIRFRMEQQGLSQRDLIPYIGSRSKVSEVLARKRPLNLSMIRALSEGLDIPARCLIRERESVEEELDMELDRLPWTEMINRNWIKAHSSDLPNRMHELFQQFLSPLGEKKNVSALYRISKNIRSARKMDKYSLFVWTVRVFTQALNSPSRNIKYEATTIDEEFMRKITKLSWSDKGPLLAKEFLEHHGVVLVVERHLPRTSLDGASMMQNGRPVIGLTLRYDRLDNFWYTLMHELAHIVLHLNSTSEVFYDDLDSDHQGNNKEFQADTLASEVLIPRKVWESNAARKIPSPQAVQRLARELEIHPAIVAGRLRYERRNFRILSHMVGHNKVRDLFDLCK